MIVTANNKRQYKTVSRWIRVQCKEITRRHSLEPYADFRGLHRKTAEVLCFRHSGRWYALSQFVRIHPIFFENEDGKTSYLSGGNCENYYCPELIEISDDGEHIRLWEEVKKNECLY